MDNTWILKRTDGAHGDDIMLMDSKADILDFLDAQEDPKTPAWLVQKYVERPLLLEGSRKFDMRMWVLLDSQFNIRVFREGVLRTCSVPFTLDDLSNNYAHISNHGLQEKHADFGSKEEGNELMFSAFAKFLKTKGAALEDVIEQANEIICTTLLAVKDKEEKDKAAGLAPDYGEEEAPKPVRSPSFKKATGTSSSRRLGKEMLQAYTKQGKSLRVDDKFKKTSFTPPPPPKEERAKVRVYSAEDMIESNKQPTYAGSTKSEKMEKARYKAEDLISKRVSKGKDGEELSAKYYDGEDVDDDNENEGDPEQEI